MLFGVVVPDRKGSSICGGRFNDTLNLGNTMLLETHPAQSNVPGKIKASDGWLGKLGYDNCNCSVAANYKITAMYYGTTGFFSYTGSTNVDSLVWSWGDGTQNTYKSNFTATISHVYSKAGRYPVCVTAYNDTCNDNQYCGMLPLAVSNTLPDGVAVYPNPAAHELYVEHLAGGSLHIVSVTGQTRWILASAMKRNGWTSAIFPQDIIWYCFAIIGAKPDNSLL